MFPKWRKVTQKLCIEVMYWKCDIFLLCSFPINWGHSVISVTFRSICYFSDTVVSVHTAVNAATWILTSEIYERFLPRRDSRRFCWTAFHLVCWRVDSLRWHCLERFWSACTRCCSFWNPTLHQPANNGYLNLHILLENWNRNVQPWNNVGLLCGKCHRVIKRY